MITRNPTNQHDGADGEVVFLFPRDRAGTNRLPKDDSSDRAAPIDGEPVLRLIDDVSRRIDRLARELNVLGHFDDDPDRPRAA